MRRTQARQAELALPLDADPCFAEIPCRRCGTLGVAIVALGSGPNGAIEKCWCGPDCARADGNPLFAEAPAGATLLVASE